METMRVLPPSDDHIFKAILTKPEAKVALIDLISSVIGRNVLDAKLRENELPIDNVDEKQERFDVSCTTEDGSLIDLEIQASRMKEDAGDLNLNLEARLVYYVCDLFVKQDSKGIPYADLAKAYQITFCSFRLYPDEEGYINSFAMQNDKGRRLSDKIACYVIELPKLRDILEKPVESMDGLEMWSAYLGFADNEKYREVIEKIVSAREAIKVADNILINISKNEMEQAAFRRRKKYQMDLQSNMITMFNNGSNERAIKIAQNMKHIGMPFYQIAELTGLNEEEVKRI